MRTSHLLLILGTINVFFGDYLDQTSTLVIGIVLLCLSFFALILGPMVEWNFWFNETSRKNARLTRGSKEGSEDAFH